MLKYEIEYTFWREYPLESEIAMLTGLPLEDILPHSEHVKHWNGQAFVKIFQALGYNCNPRFVKFDKETPYPCLMRCKIPKVNRYWHGWVYYDGFIYDLGNGKLTWAEWNHVWPNYKITSMLQVWI